MSKQSIFRIILISRIIRRGVKRHAAWRVKSLDAMKKFCKNKKAVSFLKPVDAEKCDMSDYELVVQKPMDLNAILKRISMKTGEPYPNMSEFVEEVELVFTNAKMYNNPDHEIHKEAIICQDLFYEMFRAIVQKHGDPTCRRRWKYFYKPGGFKHGLEFEEKFGNTDYVKEAMKEKS